jgi:hypothetical protein
MQREMEIINELVYELNRVAEKAFEEIEVEDKEQLRLLSRMVILSERIKFESKIALKFPNDDVEI